MAGFSLAPDFMTQDFRHACRSLARSPGFAAIAILTLGIGIGLNTALFSIINVMLFKPLAVERGDELIWLSSASTKPNGPQGNLTYPDVADLDALDVLRGATAFGYFPANLASDGGALRLDAQAVMGNFFDVVGVSAARGRMLAASPAAASERSVVISYGLWQRLFGGRDDVIGQAVKINGRDFTVIGVAPRGFRGVDVMERADLWIPLALAGEVNPDNDSPLTRNSWWLTGGGRLAPGVTIDRAAAVVRERAAAIARDFADSHDSFTVRVAPVRGINPGDRDKVKPIAALLLGVTLTVLLIACANVANLLVVKGVAEQRETAIRIALGASRLRLLRLQLVESGVLACAGGACALLFSLWFTDALLQFAGVPIDTTVSPDRRVLLFTSALSLATAVVFGLTPALSSSNIRPAPALKGASGSGDARSRSRLQSALVAGQLALSMVLLLTAALFLKSLAVASRLDVGFDPRGRIALAFNLKMHRYTPERAGAFQRALLDRVRSRAGVHAATLAAFVPLGGRVALGGLSVPGRPSDPNVRLPRVAFNQVWPQFFETLDIRIVRGRPLTDADMRTPRTTAVVNQALADREWPGQDPVGQRLSLQGPGGPFLEVVGVAANTIVDELGEPPMAMAYLPGDRVDNDVALIAWVDGEPGEALRSLEADVRALDGSIAIFDPKTLDAHIADRMDSERGLSRMLSVAGAIALALAALGLYGVVGYMVARRTREIGVRMALGARPAGLVRLFVADAARLALIGVACGLPPAVAVTAVLASNLVGGRVGDPAALGAVTSVLIVVVLIAAYVPARRALRVDPIVALRAE
jgi:predicted permease